MSWTNPLNVYKGADSMKQYYDPDVQPPMPLVELPGRLNPFKEDGVHIYAKMVTALPAHNVKSLPALNMLQQDTSAAHRTIVEQSSGSTAMSLGLIGRILYDNRNCRAFVSNKAGASRIKQLRFFGIAVELYGGPSQPAIPDPRGAIQKLHRLGQEDEGFINPGQYDNDDNWKAHIRWTGPQILRQLPEINVFCMAMGSSGCIAGTGTYLKSQKPSVKVVGVCFPVGDIVPGPRSLPLVEQCNFPWRQAVDSIEIVKSPDAYRLSMELSREGLICGPSSGLNLQGLLDFLRKAKEKGELNNYAEPSTGEISCVFVCCDLPYQYLEGYYSLLEENDFPPVINESLLDVDTNEYSADWELDVPAAMTLLYGHHSSHEVEPFHSVYQEPEGSGSDPPSSSSNITVVDFRSDHDFHRAHVVNAINAPLGTLTAATPSPFDDVSVLRRQWEDLKSVFGSHSLGGVLEDKSRSYLFLCYNGETSRLATAFLRGENVIAYSLRGGMTAASELQISTDPSYLNQFARSGSRHSEKSSR